MSTDAPAHEQRLQWRAHTALVASFTFDRPEQMVELARFLDEGATVTWNAEAKVAHLTSHSRTSRPGTEPVTNAMLGLEDALLHVDLDPDSRLLDVSFTVTALRREHVSSACDPTGEDR